MTCGGENGTNRSDLAIFSEDVAFAYHFMALRLPPSSHPIGVLVVLPMPVKWWQTQLAIQCTVDTMNYFE